MVTRGEAEELARYAAKIRGVERVRKGLGRPIGGWAKGSKIVPWGLFFFLCFCWLCVFVLLSCFA